MLRKFIIAFTAIAAIGIAATPTGASAAWHSHGGGWHGGWHGTGWGYYGGPYLAGPWPYYGCNQMRRVPTPYGLRWRKVWVCG